MPTHVSLSDRLLLQTKQVLLLVPCPAPAHPTNVFHNRSQLALEGVRISKDDYVLIYARQSCAHKPGDLQKQVAQSCVLYVFVVGAREMISEESFQGKELDEGIRIKGKTGRLVATRMYHA